MLRTSDSHDRRWRYAEVEVRADDPASGAILREINLLLAARGAFEEYIGFVDANTGDASESLARARERLLALKRKIPSCGELRSQSWPVDPGGAITWFYKKRYAEYPFGAVNVQLSIMANLCPRHRPQSSEARHHPSAL